MISDTHCGPEHQRQQAIAYRRLLRAAMHSSRLPNPNEREKQVQDFVRVIAEVDHVLGDVACD